MPDGGSASCTAFRRIRPYAPASDANAGARPLGLRSAPPPVVRRLPLLALLLAIAVGCDTADRPTIGGTYTGTAEEAGAGRAEATLTLPTTRSGEPFTFRLDVEADDGSVLLTETASGTGRYDHPDIEATVRESGLLFTVRGTVRDDGDALDLTYAGRTFTLHRD